MADPTLLSIDALAAAGFLSPSKELRVVAARYSVALTPIIATRIDRNNPNDPIARQFLPDARELISTPEELADPIGDEAHAPVPGIVHRYADRVLLKLVSVCPVYCRFCFRRETVGRGKGKSLNQAELDAALAYVAANDQIAEVILTGGDPMVASARRLRHLAERLALIPHVKFLRVHTRVVVAAPQLVTSARLAALRAGGKRLRMALHINHTREIGPEARAAIARLRKDEVDLLSQTVLLKGVNDDVNALEELMRAFAALGVKAYYLHHPDLAPGTSHFRPALDEGRKLHAELTYRLGEELTPRYVLDLPGGFGKIPIAAPHLWRAADGRWRARDRFGVVHEYGEGESVNAQAIESLHALASAR